MSKQTQTIEIASQKVNQTTLARLYYHKKFIDLMKLHIESAGLLNFIKRPQSESSKIWLGAGVEVINFGLIKPKTWNPAYNEYSAPMTTPADSVEVLDQKTKLVFSLLVDKYTNTQYFANVEDYNNYFTNQANALSKSIAYNLQTFLYSFFTEYDEAGILEDSQQTEAAKIREIFNTGETIENKDPIEIYKKIKQKARALKKPRLSNSFSGVYPAAAGFGDLVLIVPEGYKDQLLEATATKYNTDFYQDLNKFYDVIEVPGLTKFICIDKDAIQVYPQLEEVATTSLDAYNLTTRVFHHFWYVFGFLKNAAGFVLKFEE